MEERRWQRSAGVWPLETQERWRFSTGRSNTKARDEIAWRRLLHGAAAARQRHRQVRSRADLGFYHGLLTGYAVALKTLEGKVGQSRR
ncbi:MAG TPA: hypothetical protein VFP86_04285 [bacterium]|nr:hypothetical protein [bacterium]